MHWKWNCKGDNIQILSSEIILAWKNGSQGRHFGKILNSKFLKGLRHSALSVTYFFLMWGDWVGWSCREGWVIHVLLQCVGKWKAVIMAQRLDKQHNTSLCKPSLDWELLVNDCLTKNYFQVDGCVPKSLKSLLLTVCQNDSFHIWLYPYRAFCATLILFLSNRADWKSSSFQFDCHTVNTNCSTWNPIDGSGNTFTPTHSSLVLQWYKGYFVI